MLPDPLWDFSQGAWYFSFSLCISYPIFKREIIYPYLIECSCSFFGGKLWGPKQVQTETLKYFQMKVKKTQKLQRHIFSPQKNQIPPKTNMRGRFSVQNEPHQILPYLRYPKAVPRSLAIRSSVESICLSPMFMAFWKEWPYKREFLFTDEVLINSFPITITKQVGFSSGVSSDS